MSTYSTLVLGEPGLLGYWRLGETDGTLAADASDGGHDGTYTGRFTLGQPGALATDDDTAVHFENDFPGGHIETAFAPFVTGAELTLEGWAYRDDTAAIHALFGGDNSGDRGNRPILDVQSGGNAVWFVGSTSVSWPGVIPTGEWFHWAITYTDATRTAELFINGTSLGTRVSPDSFPAVSSRLWIGRYGGGASWHGRLDEFAVYDGILPATVITQHYHAGVDTPRVSVTPESVAPATRWEWVLADQAGAEVYELATAEGRSLYFQRNGAPEATCGLSHDDEAVWHLSRILRNGLPQLYCYRDGELRFRGRLDVQVETLGVAALLAPTFRGPFATLLPGGASGGRFTAVSRTFSQVDAGLIAWTLIDETNAESPTGIVLGEIEATVPRDRTYESKAVGEAVVELSQVRGGFDFEVAPLEGPDMGEFNVYARQGQDRPVAIFEHGAETLANVTEVTRTTTPPVNRVRYLGANGLVSEREDASSIARYGLFMRLESASDVSEQATLDAKAEAALRPEPVRVVQFKPDPVLDPKPWGDYWLGDTLRFAARRGFRAEGVSAFEEELAPRLNALRVGIGTSGDEESHELSIAAEGVA